MTGTSRPVAHPTASVSMRTKRPAVDVVIPYDRGDLVARMHADGRVQLAEHNTEGTRIRARVPVALAASLREFSTSDGQAGPS